MNLKYFFEGLLPILVLNNMAKLTYVLDKVKILDDFLNFHILQSSFLQENQVFFYLLVLLFTLDPSVMLEIPELNNCSKLYCEESIVPKLELIVCP